MKKIYLLFIILMSCFVFSQEKNNRNTKNKTNHIDIKAKPPIDIIIDPLDTVDPQETIEPVSTLFPSLETSEVGKTNGDLSVTGTGGAVYNVPIALPPGINNVAPNISLNYNSQSGDGNAGYGWNISGVSRISRVPSTLYHDGIIDPVDYDNYDRFALDGQRLILKSGTYGNTGSTYETENFSNLIITLQSNAGLYWFIVENPDGSVAKYGNDIDSNNELTYQCRLVKDFIKIVVI